MGDLCEFGVDFEAEVVPFHVFARDGGGAAPDEGVENEVFFVRVLLEEVPDEAHGSPDLWRLLYVVRCCCEQRFGRGLVGFCQQALGVGGDERTER